MYGADGRTECSTS